MARKPKKLPDYFTTDEARALATAAPSYPTRMAMRIMLRAGLRVSECLSLCAADLRLSQDPPIIFLRPEVTENKSKKGREVPIPADLVESLGDLASIHAKDRRKPLFDISRQWVSKSMKEAAIEAGLDTAHGPTPTRCGTPTAGTLCWRECLRRCSSSGWDTIPWRRRNATCSWPAATTTG